LCTNSFTFAYRTTAAYLRLYLQPIFQIGEHWISREKRRYTAHPIPVQKALPLLLDGPSVVLNASIVASRGLAADCVCSHRQHREQKVAILVRRKCAVPSVRQANYAAFVCCFTLAHRARWNAAIFLRAATARRRTPGCGIFANHSARCRQEIRSDLAKF
jgi:hypothetical protein